MNRLVIACCAWCFLFGGLPITTAAKEEVTLKFEFKPRGDCPCLRVVFKNTTSRTLEMYRSALPWGNRYSLVLTAVRAHAGNEPLKSAPLIDDPGPETITISPGQSVTGEIDLRHFFKDIVEVRERDGILLMWSYAPELTNGSSLDRITGGLEIDKTP